MGLELITPTQFIYQAAMATPEVPVAMGKTATYKDISLVDVPDSICWLCGGPTRGRGQMVKKIIKKTFTDYDKARTPQSKSVCTGCCFCLSFMSLRNYSILATEEGLRHPDRPTLRKLLLTPPTPPFLLTAATSGQKWLHFKGEIAYSRNKYPVQHEDIRVYVDRQDLGTILKVIEELYTVFTKAEILSGQYSLNRIKQFGLSRFQDVAGQAEHYRGTRIFDLALFVAQKPEKEE